MLRAGATTHQDIRLVRMCREDLMRTLLIGTQAKQYPIRPVAIVLIYQICMDYSLICQLTASPLRKRNMQRSAKVLAQLSIHHMHTHYPSSM